MSGGGEKHDIKIPHTDNNNNNKENNGNTKIFNELCEKITF